MDILIRLADLPKNAHPPYLDPRLTATLGSVFRSVDGRLIVTYWEAWGPGRLLESPKADELIYVMDGEALVEWNGQTIRARPGDVILWLPADPAIITVVSTLRAMCVAYKPDEGAHHGARGEDASCIVDPH